MADSPDNVVPLMPAETVLDGLKNLVRRIEEGEIPEPERIVLVAPPALPPPGEPYDGPMILVWSFGGAKGGDPAQQRAEGAVFDMQAAINFLTGSRWTNRKPK